MNNAISRRSLLLGSGATVATATFAMPAFAISKASSQKLVEALIARVLKVVNANISDAKRFAEFEKIFATYADVPLIARKSLGTAYKSASASQKTAYVNAFKGYMARSYGGRYFQEFIGAKIDVTSVKKGPGGYLVNTRVSFKTGAPISAQWHVISSGGKDKMYNIFVEGVSILTDTRTQIGAMLDRRGGNLDKLIAHLKTAS